MPRTAELQRTTQSVITDRRGFVQHVTALNEAATTVTNAVTTTLVLLQSVAVYHTHTECLAGVVGEDLLVAMES